MAGLLLTAPSLHADEAALNQHWGGAWALTKAETSSDCADRYTDNEVRDGRITSKGAHRFAPGELVRVARIDVHRKQIEVFLDVAEALLVSHRDGPFTLFDERRCKIELEIRLPSSGRTDAVINAAIEAVLDRFGASGEALASDSWNGREREPYPEDYEATLAEYEVWKLEQVNSAVAERIEDSIDEARRILDRLDDDAVFLAGFAEGIEDARRRTWRRDCEDLIDLRESSFSERPPSGHSDDWDEGFDEGQELVFHVELADRLHDCFR